MDEYIKREAAINAALLVKSDADITLVPGSFTNGFIEGAKIKENAILNALADVHAADVAPIKLGRWIKLDMHSGMEQYKCSACNQECYVPTCMGEPLYDYCPNCGAKMDGDEE